MAEDDGPLLHFTKDQHLESILRSGTLIPGPTPFGVRPWPESLDEAHRSVCFTERTVEDPSLFPTRKGKWGIAFKRSFLEAQGARPVTYLTSAETAERRWENDSATGRASHPMWKDNPYLSPTQSNYSFAWEKEWRVAGTVRFDWDDVEFLISPDGAQVRVVNTGQLGSVSRYSDPESGAWLVEWEDGASEPFNRVMRQAVAEFDNGFITPEDAGFCSDPEDETGYSWPVDRYDEWQVLEDIVPAMPDWVLDELVDELRSRAWYWAKISELDDFYREVEEELRPSAT